MADPNYNNPFEALAFLKEELLKKEKAQARAQAQAQVQAKAKAQAQAKKAQAQAREDPSQAAPSSPGPDDETLFLREMADVVPLKESSQRANVPPARRAFKLPDQPDEDAQVLGYLADLVGGRAEFDLSYSDEYVEGKLKSLPNKVMDDLKRGRMPVQDYLDLHGLTLVQAEAAIVDFILNSISLRRRCLLLVHGRGHRSPDGVAVLKHNLEHLLLRHPIKRYILAFTTARPIDGGFGASYILLRK
jgi:DNA-nicking Smr family endonuclease